jgi:hypothetical protein
MQDMSSGSSLASSPSSSVLCGGCWSGTRGEFAGFVTILFYTLLAAFRQQASAGGWVMACLRLLHTICRTPDHHHTHSILRLTGWARSWARSWNFQGCQSLWLPPGFPLLCSIYPTQPSAPWAPHPPHPPYPHTYPQPTHSLRVLLQTQLQLCWATPTLFRP